METIECIPMIYGECVEDRDAAVGVLNSKTDWCLGLILNILYRDASYIVQVLTAIGIKNCDECGPNGTEDDDKWINTYYESESDAHGEEFYRIVGDSGSNASSHGVGSYTGLHTTKVNMNGSQYEVLNSKEDSEVANPFVIQKLQKLPGTQGV